MKAGADEGDHREAVGSEDALLFVRVPEVPPFELGLAGAVHPRNQVGCLVLTMTLKVEGSKPSLA